MRTERVRGPARARRLDERALLSALGDDSLDACWERLRARPFLVADDRRAEELERVAPGEPERVLAAAARAAAARSSTSSAPARSGSDGRPTGTPTSRSGTTWPPAWWRDARLRAARPAERREGPVGDLAAAVAAAGRPGVPARRRRAPRAAPSRETLEEWIEANPYGESVNWASPMEAAIRILTFTWLFHALGGSESWRDPAFRLRFLRGVYLHGDFVARNLELSDVNGNHLDADAAGIVFAGLFFGSRPRARRAGRERGWSLLVRRTATAGDARRRRLRDVDGVPPARDRAVPPPRAPSRRARAARAAAGIVERLEAMARFAAAYTRPDGSSPAWGDADDARALPLGGQALGDHRYLGATMAAAWGADVPVSGPRARGRLAARPRRGRAPLERRRRPESAALRRRRLRRSCAAAATTSSSTAARSGSPAAAATATTTSPSLDADARRRPARSSIPARSRTRGSPEWRNRFRSTAAHNAVQVDGEELNRLGEPHHLWSLRDDARPLDPAFTATARLPDVPRSATPATAGSPTRSTSREPCSSTPSCTGSSCSTTSTRPPEHELSAPLHAAARAPSSRSPRRGSPHRRRGRRQLRRSSGRGGDGGAGAGWFSPSYGVKVRGPDAGAARDAPPAAGSASPFAPAGDAASLEDLAATRAWRRDARVARSS